MKPFFLYVIGISGSGKTTIATALEKRIREDGLDSVQFIDGDVIRSEFGGIFGYTFEERMKCNKAVDVVCSYLVRNGISVILAQVGAYRKMRAQVKSYFPNNYVEAYIKCSPSECERRDVKGYYKKAREGLINNLNGTNDAFESPENSDIIIDTEKCSVEDAVEALYKLLKERGYI